MPIDVNPNILMWAREEAGMTLGDVSSKLGINILDLSHWETIGRVSFSDLENLAHLYKRQTAIFFLNEVPKKVRKPKDYRNLATGETQFSPKTMLAIRRAERYLKISRDLFTSEYWKDQYAWLKDFSGKADKVEKEVTILRNLLEIDSEYSYKKSEDLFRKLRDKVERKLGIFVFQFPMPEEELDGFSYAFDQFPYAIVINNQNAPVKKIFTLFHELGHILKHDPGACKNNFKNDTLPIELECNNFAGKFLVPTELLVKTQSVDKIFELASNFNVSGEVYLRRLNEEKKISKSIFFELLEPVRERSRSFKKDKKKQEGGPSMVVQSKSTRGSKFFEIVTTGAAGGKVSYSTASDLLGLKVGNIRL